MNYSPNHQPSHLAFKEEMLYSLNVTILAIFLTSMPIPSSQVILSENNPLVEKPQKDF